MAANTTIAPASTVTITSLTVGEGGVVSEADQLAATIDISGKLSAALPAGDTVQIVLPSGIARPASVAANGTDFALVLTGTAAIAFAIPGQVSAYVADGAGNQSASFTQSFVAASARSVAPVTATPADFSSSGASALALSGDGKSVAFVANQTVGNTVQFGLYVKRLDTGTLTLVSAAGRAPGLSADGNLVAYVESPNNDQVFVKNLTTGVVTQLSDPAGNGASGPLNGTRPSIANDGTVVFESAGETALKGDTNQQIYAAHISGGVATNTLISVASDGTPGNGFSESGTISADGSTVVFHSNATNLLSATDPHAAALTGTFQIYARALRDNPATGQRAGTTVLVSIDPDGTVSNGSDYGPSVSGDGRFVVFEASDGQVHLTDLLTGVSQIVSTNASGVAANAIAFGATISADGTTVVFQSSATNLLAAGDVAVDLTHSQQIYAKNLATGQVTLLSEGGYTPADAVSQDPAISADGTVAAFASTADNLAPGVLGSGNPAVISRGYVTSVVVPPSLAVTAPAATLQTTSLVLTGTIDHAHSTTPITITDAADPGFPPVTATVTAGTDPYVDTWTATVIFTQAGAQTVTVTAGSTSVQANVTVLNAPSLTIDALGSTNSITTTNQPGHVTIVTGTNPAGIGNTVSLSLRTADNRLLSLGTTATGTDGRWSISVPDAALGTQSSTKDALVAETVDASGTKTRAALSIALSVLAPTLLYTYRFTYTDGSFYSGTVADDGTYGYAPGQTITTSAGRYVIGAVGVTTTQPVGSVTVSSYYDVSTSASYTPASATKGIAAGAGGLKSESDSITGPGGTQSFGGGVTEARQSAATAYSFAFLYNDGSAYYGTVVGGATSGYQAGQTLKSSSGTYKITGSQGATTAAIGTVSTSLYYDATSAATYVPTLYSQGLSSGAQGLGSEVDSLPTSSGTTTKFGLGGTDKAAFKLSLTYDFRFDYPDGSRYFGRVVDDGTYGYSVNEVKATQYGKYTITAVTLSSEMVAGALLTPGDVFVYEYDDSSSGTAYTPVKYAQDELDGTTGLGTEGDFISSINGDLPFGFGSVGNKTYEAKVYPDQAFRYTFTYKDGSNYSGTVYDDGSYGYYVGQTIPTIYGHYYIKAGTPLSVAQSKFVTAGEVYSGDYLDVTSLYTSPYQTVSQTASNGTPSLQSGVPTGQMGLGSEYDAVLDSTGVPRPFGYGGKIEAKFAPNTLLRFIFWYPDQSNYIGDISSDGVNGPKLGDTIHTSYGFYSFDAWGGATSLTPGFVTISSYYDVTNNTKYPNVDGIGSSLQGEVGYAGGLQFGYGGAKEAKHGTILSWTFQFVYLDHSQYGGHVVDNGQFGYHDGFIENTPYGYYYIFGNTSVSALPVGSVTLSYYYDSTTGQNYPPTDELPGGIDGTAGLGSESAGTEDNGVIEPFGYGGAEEAKQSQVRHFTFIFRYTDGSFYSGDFASYQHLYLAGTVIPATGGYYTITAFDDEHSSLPSGTVHVSSYFDIGTGRFYTPVRYANGQASGTSDIGSELDYLVGVGGLSSFGGPSHIEARPATFSSTRLITAAVYAFDGPLQGATVGYLNPKALAGTLSIDPAQPTAITNADGSYQLDAGTGPLVLTGGTDTATGLAFKGVLESAGNGSVLSPLTTMLEAVAVARGDTSVSGITAAETLLSTALGLPAGLDLTSYLPGQILSDPTTSANDIATAEAVYRAGAKLLDAETLIDAGGGNSLAAINTVANALANGSVTDLTDLSPLIEDGGLPPPAETAIKIIISATNAIVDQQLAGLTVPDAILRFITGSSIALQGSAATALAATNADDTAIASNYAETLAQTTLPQADQVAFDASTACYGRGTAILTPQGEVKVEALRIGEHLITASGLPRPIRWIGHRHVACLRHPHPEQVWPVRVRAGAFAADQPCRDLLLSPDHAVFADGVLIPIKHLINGSSIAQIAAEQVEYWHVELDSHDLLLADGLPAESYLDTGNRAAFANADVPMQLHPDFAARSWHDACAELVQEGPRLIAVKQRLFARAAITAAPPVLGLEVIAGRQPLTPSAILPGVWRYAVPPGGRSLRLLSPRWMPAAHVAASLDRRQLGVRLLGVDIGEENVALDAPHFFSGFHPAETTAEGTCRWTNGDAQLVLPACATTVTLRVGDDATAVVC